MKKYNGILKWIFLLVMIGGGVYFYNLLPDIVPIHWNIEGEVDNYASKNYTVILIPIITLAMLVLFRFLPMLDPKKDKYEKFADIYEIIQAAIIGFFTYMYFVTMVAALNAEMNVGMYVMFGIGVLFILMGNYLGKVRQNYFVGIKTPWTLENEEVWNKTHRLGGWCFVLAGLIFVAQAFVGVMSIWVFVLAIVISSLVPVGYSYWLYKQIKK